MKPPVVFNKPAQYWSIDVKADLLSEELMEAFEEVAH